MVLLNEALPKTDTPQPLPEVAPITDPSTTPETPDKPVVPAPLRRAKPLRNPVRQPIIKPITTPDTPFTPVQPLDSVRK